MTYLRQLDDDLTRDRSTLDEGSFDTVVLRDVFSHDPGVQQRIVDHFARLVRPGGHLYLLDVDQAWAHPDAGGRDRHPGRLAELGRSAGLVVEAVLGWSEVGDGQPAPAPGDPVPDRDLARWEAAFDEIDLWTECPRFTLRVAAAVCRRATEPSVTGTAPRGAGGTAATAVRGPESSGHPR